MGFTLLDPAESPPAEEEVLAELTIIEKLELHGGATAAEGNVYINQQPVCDDGWSDGAAEVVCRMLGYSGAVTSTDRSHFGLVPEDFILSNLVCSGKEASILNCTASPALFCEVSEGAGVICQGGANLASQLNKLVLILTTTCSL